MAEFAYNNVKNDSICHTLFELNCGYHPWVLFEENINPRLRSRSINKLVEELREVIEIYYQNLFHAQKLQKKAYDKRVKSWSYTLSGKVCLNSTYIKTKRNKKLENTFFRPFQVLYIVQK